MNANRYVPQDSTPIERAGLPAIVYAYTSPRDGKPAAIAYTGKSSKNTWHYRFTNEAQREARISQFFDGVARQEDFKLSRKTERAAFKHSYKMGDILYSSWGWEQTNIDFYQVTATTEKTITVCQIKADRRETGFMCGETTPRPYEYIPGQTFTRKVRLGGHISIAAYDSCSAWEGKPVHFSSYA